LLRALSFFCLKNLRYSCAIKPDMGQKRVFMCRLVTRLQEYLVTSYEGGRTRVKCTVRAWQVAEERLQQK
jgi:hypothetical protein